MKNVGVVRKLLSFLPSVDCNQWVAATRRLMCALALTWLAIAAQGANTFTPTGSLANARIQDTATLLSNGKVLVAGGLDDFSGTSLAIFNLSLVN